MLQVLYRSLVDGQHYAIKVVFLCVKLVASVVWMKERTLVMKSDLPAPRKLQYTLCKSLLIYDIFVTLIYLDKGWFNLQCFLGMFMVEVWLCYCMSLFIIIFKGYMS